MRKFILSNIVALFALFVLSMPANAGWGWCLQDPVVRLNGTDVQILVAVPDLYQPLVSGPIAFDIHTPRSVERELVYTDEGFNGHGEVVEFTDWNVAAAAGGGRFPILIEASVPVDEALGVLPVNVPVRIPMQVTVIQPGAQPMTFWGTTDKAVASVLVQGATR